MRKALKPESQIASKDYMASDKTGLICVDHQDSGFWSEKTIPARLAAERHRISTAFGEDSELAKLPQTISCSTVSAPPYKPLRLQRFRGFDRMTVVR
jgi:hypothetical protein